MHVASLEWGLKRISSSVVMVIALIFLYALVRMQSVKWLLLILSSVSQASMRPFNSADSLFMKCAVKTL